MTDTKILQQFTGEEVVALGPLDQLTQHELASRMPAMTADEKGAMLASVQLNPDFVTVILYEAKSSTDGTVSRRASKPGPPQNSSAS